MAPKAKGGKGGRRKGAGKKARRRTPVPKAPPTTREKIARPLREAAARARRLLKRLAGLRGAAGRKLREIYRHESRAGDLEALQAIVEALEGHAATFDMSVDFSPLRRRLEALLSVLLEVSDDQLAAAAARPLAEEVAGVLHRAEALFLLPAALYRALDPVAEDLAAVRDAVAAESFDLARDALLEHLRVKEPPGALASWLLECPERCLAEAELITHGFCRDRGHRGARDRGRVWRFVGTPFRWEDLKFALPHGHVETAALAKAYAASGNESFAAEAVNRLLGWAAAVAPPPAAVGGVRRPVGDPSGEGAWEPERAAARLMNWSVCLLALRASHTFTPETARVMLLLAHESAEHLRRCAGQLASLSAGAQAGGSAAARLKAGQLAPGSAAARLKAGQLAPGSAGARLKAGQLAPGSAAARLKAGEGEARAGAALAVAGELFAEFSAASEWRETGRRLLDEAAAERVLPDGGDASLSLAVHERTLDSFVAGALSGGGASPARAAADRMLAFERAILMPGGELPGGHDPQAAAQRLARLDLAASLLGIAEERASGPEFHAFEQSGYYVMRTGRDPGADCLLLRPAGTWGLRVACSGREVLAGPASPVPAASEDEPQLRPPPDASAAEAGRARRARQEAEGPKSVVYRAGPPCDYVRVLSGLGASCDTPGATHRREALFFERRWWALADRVRSEEETAWAIKLALEAPPEDATPDGRRFISHGLLVALAGPTDTGFRFESDERGHTVARAESTGRDVSFVTLLYPLRGEDAASISIEPVAAGGGRIAGFTVRREGAEGLVAFPHGEGTELEAVPAAEEAVALSRSRGSWRTVFTAG
ncbi:MAG: heparinase II/III family protein [Planctomycetota bacterium]